ncbi:MAG: thioredoxin family protein [Oscillochloridaceae bacterium umkhey_bin13]
MLERMLVLVALAVLIGVAWAGVRWLQQRRLCTLAVERPFAGVITPGRPTVVAFTLPSCSECRARQAPALERLRHQAGATISVTLLSAEVHPTLVERLGIMTVPATAVVTADGRVKAINQGYADEARLLQQLAG